MISVQNTDGVVRFWYDGRNSLLRDVYGIPVARIKGDEIYALSGQRVAFWKKHKVVDLDGTVLLRCQTFCERPEPRSRAVLLPHEALVERAPDSIQKPWRSERGLVEALRLMGRAFVRI